MKCKYVEKCWGKHWMIIPRYCIENNFYSCENCKLHFELEKIRGTDENESGSYYSK